MKDPASELSATIGGQTAQRMGRPYKLHADDETLRLLAIAGELCAGIREVAGLLRVSPQTVTDFFDRCPESRAAYEDAIQRGKFSLRMKLFKLADTNASAAIFLAKNWLGMTDSPAVEQFNGFNHTAIAQEVRAKLLAIVSGNASEVDLPRE
jgi:hypothetical protein